MQVIDKFEKCMSIVCDINFQGVTFIKMYYSSYFNPKIVDSAEDESYFLK